MAMKVGSSRAKDGWRSWVFLAITGCVVGLVGGVFDSFGILLVIFVEYFDETNAKIGWVGSLAFALLCLSYPASVSFFHRFGFRPAMFTSAVLVSIAFLTTPLVPSANFLFFTYCIPFGIGIGFLDCLSITVLSEYFEKSLGSATGIRLASVATASMIFNFLYPILIENMGWKKTMYCLSSVGASLVLYAYSYKKQPRILRDRQVIYAKESDVTTASKTNDLQSRTSERGFMHDRGFQMIVIGCIPFLCMVSVPFMFMAQYAKSLGYPLYQSKWLLVVRSLASLVGRAMMGFAGDFALRHGIITHIASGVTVMFGLASGLCSLTQNLSLMILYMSVTGLLEGMFWVIIPLMMNELTGGINADYAFSRMSALTAVGYLTGPSSMGWLYDITGDFRNVLYVICVCGLVAGLTIALGVLVRSNHLNTCLTKFLGKKHLDFTACQEQEMISDKEVMAQFETAV